MLQGKVRYFNEERGYGFIACSDGRDVFVHCSAILMDGWRTLANAQRVEFEVEQTEKGLRAIRVRPLEEDEPRDFGDFRDFGDRDLGDED